MDTLPELSPSDLDALTQLHHEVQGAGTVVLDPRDERHRAAIEASLRSAGRHPDRYPALHASLDQGPPAADSGGAGDTGGSRLVDAGVDREGRSTALVWHRAPGTPLAVGSSLHALDLDRPALLAHGHNTSLTGFLETSTDTSTAAAAASAAHAGVLDIAHVTYPDGTTRFTALAGTATAAAPTGEPLVSQPVVQIPSHTSVVIALGRDSNTQNPDADYTFTEPQNVFGDPYVIIPFACEVEFAYPIVGSLGQPVAGATLTTVAYLTGPTVTTLGLDPTYTPAARLAGGAQIDAFDANVLRVEYRADGNSYQNTSALVYRQSGLVNNGPAAFFFQCTVPLQSPGGGTATFAVFSSNSPNQPSGSNAVILPLQFWWHCLAAGTRVRVDDGSEALIEDLDNTGRVRSADGGHLAVEATSRGLHAGRATEPGVGAVYRLRTASGHELIATGAHPIVVPSGGGLTAGHVDLVAVADLEVGQQVVVEDGVSEVAVVEAIDHDGPFANLKLGDDADRAAATGPIVGTFLANGIAVGDHAAMQVHAERRRLDLDHMLPRLEPELRQDYASTVADLRY